MCVPTVTNSLKASFALRFSFSLFGVCLMASYQAQYILNEFSTPSTRSNHNSALPRDNGPVNSNITPNGVRYVHSIFLLIFFFALFFLSFADGIFIQRIFPPTSSKTKGSCKSYVETCHPSDKGKGRGSPALANSPAQRPQSSKKGSSATPAQTQRKHKVSLYYSKYKSSVSTITAGAVNMDEEPEELSPEQPLTPDSDVCNNNNEPAFVSELDKSARMAFRDETHGTVEEREPAAVMFPMEIAAGFPENVTLSPGPRPGLLLCSPVEKSCTEHFAEKINSDKRDSFAIEVMH